MEATVYNSIHVVTKKWFNEFLTANENNRKFEPEGLFMFKADRKYIGVDNSTGEAWTEEFGNMKKCLEWLRKEANVI